MAADITVVAYTIGAQIAATNRIAGIREDVRVLWENGVDVLVLNEVGMQLDRHP